MVPFAAKARQSVTLHQKVFKNGMKNAEGCAKGETVGQAETAFLALSRKACYLLLPERKRIGEEVAPIAQYNARLEVDRDG